MTGSAEGRKVSSESHKRSAESCKQVNWEQIRGGVTDNRKSSAESYKTSGGPLRDIKGQSGTIIQLFALENQQNALYEVSWEPKEVK